MDINQLQYFIAVVEADCNISAAAKNIHISQPTLSHLINTFEKDENILLFNRASGRLVSLTLEGQNFYENAKNILALHKGMMTQLRESSKVIKGKIKIGIPPLILSMVFSTVIRDLIVNNPNIEFEVVEEGAYELRKKVILGEIDLAVLLEPSDLNENLIEKISIQKGELCLFLDKNNPLAKLSTIPIENLHQQDLAIFNRDFMIHHQIMKTFQAEKITPNITITSNSWDFLLSSVSSSNLVTILPSPVNKYLSDDNIVKKSFTTPILWEKILCRQKKKHYSPLESFVHDQIISSFTPNQL